MKKINYLILIFFVVFLTTSVIPNFNTGKTNKLEILDTLNTSKTLFAISDSSGPIIGTPSLDNPNPDSDENVNVTVPIHDIDGVQNATIFWNYASINTTFYNSTIMGTTEQLFVDENNYYFPESGFITATGIKTPSSSMWAYGEYIFNESCVSAIDLEIEESPGPGTSDLIYVHIQAKNFTTGLWQTVLENGDYGENSSLSSGERVYASTDLVQAYHILAISYRDDGPATSPRFDVLEISREECEWEIPAANEATFVDYYITAFDENQS